MSIFTKIEGSIIGLSTACNNLIDGFKQDHRICIAESGFEVTGGVTAYAYYAGKFFDVLYSIENIFTVNIPFLVHIAIIPLKHALGSIGGFLNTIRAVKEGLSLYRQNQFLNLFEKHAWKGTDIRSDLAETIEHFDNLEFQANFSPKFARIVTGKKDHLIRLLKKIDSGDQEAVTRAERIFARWKGRHIRGKLATIARLPAVELERALPLWLNTDITNKGGREHYLSSLLEQVDKGSQKAIDEASKLLETMHTYAYKKSTVHLLKMIGAMIGAFSCIGFFIALPIPVTVILLIICGALAVGAYMYNSGYVENRENCFSLKLCVPEFIRNLAFDISQAPDKIRAQINTWFDEKTPAVITPHPFYVSKIVSLIQEGQKPIRNTAERILLRAS